MKLETIRRIRLMALVTEIFGLIAHIPLAFWLGIFVWLATFLHTIRVLEDKFLQEPTDEEKSDDENESR